MVTLTVFWREFSIINISVFPKLGNQISAIPIQIPTGFFIEPDKLILNCIWKKKEPRCMRDPRGRTRWGNWRMKKMFAVIESSKSSNSSSKLRLKVEQCYTVNAERHWHHHRSQGLVRPVQVRMYFKRGIWESA